MSYHRSTIRSKISSTENNSANYRENGEDNNIDNFTPELKGLIDTISVSLNGEDSKEYNDLSRPKFWNAYEEVKKFIKACSDEKIYVVASIVEGYKGRHIDLEACEKTAKDLGAKFRVREWIPAGYS